MVRGNLGWMIFYMYFNANCYLRNTQPLFTFSKSTMETREQCVKSSCLKLTIKALEPRHWHCFAVFPVNFE